MARGSGGTGPGGEYLLPQRSTRGKRLNAALEDDAEADEEFWNQEFFAEEAEDVDFKSEDEAEEEDVPDSDFDLSEGADDDDEVEEVREKPRKKALKPPEIKAHRPKPAAKAAAPGSERPQKRPADEKQEHNFEYEAPTLRRSTVARIADAQRVRQQQEQMKPKRRINKDHDQWKPLTQQELLAEAARTEVENIKSLKQLIAQEEETKRKAQIVKKKYTGPSIKFHSRKVGEEEKTTFEVCNSSQLPTWMQPAQAPRAVEQSVCEVTGLPAVYLDRYTGVPFANAAAFKRIRDTAYDQAQAQATAAPDGLAADPDPLTTSLGWPVGGLGMGNGGMVHGGRCKGLRTRRRTRPNPKAALNWAVLTHDTPRQREAQLLDLSPDMMALMVDLYCQLNGVQNPAIG